MDRTQIGDLLALVNASLNATSAVALFAGYLFIRAGKVRRHRAAMTTALAASGLFLAFYLTRVAFTGTHRFAGTGMVKAGYLAILFTHMTLAVVLVPLLFRLIWHVRRRRFSAHGRLARWTFPIWAYVSVSGLLVYLMLYRIFGYVA